MTLPAFSAPIHVIGLGLAAPKATADALLAIPAVRNAELLVAGKSLLALLADHPAEKLAVGADTTALYAALAQGRATGKRQCVLCSGDPLFFGLGARLAEALGPDALMVHPGVSSLQAAAALLGTPWERIRAVSLHGRQSYLPLAQALMSDAPVFILTDAANGPQAIAAWMLGRGFGGRTLHILDTLRQAADGSISAQKHVRMTPEEAAALPPTKTAPQRVMLVDAPLTPSSVFFGLQDDALCHEKGIFTKQPVRAAALSALGLAPHHTFWDLGSGSGAVAVEAALLLRQGQSVAVECKTNRLAHIAENRQRFGAANLDIVAGRMPACLPQAEEAPCASGMTALVADNGDTVICPRPDRIFIGGGFGGASAQTREIINRAWAVLKPGGRLLASCVLLNSLERARADLLALGADLRVICLHVSQSSPLADDMRLEALNPVFLVLAEKAVEKNASEGALPHSKTAPSPN